MLSLQQAKEDAEAKLRLSEEKVNAFLEKEKAQKQALATQLVEDALKQGKITAGVTFLRGCVRSKCFPMGNNSVRDWHDSSARTTTR
ncbi:hypothetical protein [Capnocytophaga canimorsus]|uniref:hypothetical protein n=1 Tax=Capnocytophaga canimorsus TaxID=28188 RepID=UPI00385C8D8E